MVAMAPNVAKTIIFSVMPCPRLVRYRLDTKYNDMTHATNVIVLDQR